MVAPVTAVPQMHEFVDDDVVDRAHACVGQALTEPTGEPVASASKAASLLRGSCLALRHARRPGFKLCSGIAAHGIVAPRVALEPEQLHDARQRQPLAPRGASRRLKQFLQPALKGPKLRVRHRGTPLVAERRLA